jgi:cytochrome c oxidase subunit 2
VARALVLGLLSAVVLTLSGCAANVPQTTVIPKTDAAREIQFLYEIVYYISIPVFLFVQGLILWIIFKYKAKPGDPLPPQTHGNTALEVGSTVVFAAILLVLAYFTIPRIFALESEPHTKDYMVVEVTGHQWWFEFKYPEQKIVTANELIVPVGRTVYLKMTSSDVIHSFWIPQLMGKQDIMNGHITTLWFTPEEPGQYWGQCAEYCGGQHALMRMSATVLPANEFQAWVARTSQPATPTGELAEKGAEVFAKNACVGCHTIAGTSAVGKIGPDLSHFGSRTTVGAGILPNSTEHLAAWIKDPQGLKPGNKMPNVNLAPDELEAVVEYLHSLK